MQVVTLEEVDEALRATDPDTLREMAHQLAQSHVTVCGLTSRAGDCSHIADHETRARIDELDPAQLASLLAPVAWLSLDVHSRLSR